MSKELLVFPGCVRPKPTGRRRPRPAGQKPGRRLTLWKVVGAYQLPKLTEPALVCLEVEEKPATYQVVDPDAANRAAFGNLVRILKSSMQAEGIAETELEALELFRVEEAKRVARIREGLRDAQRSERWAEESIAELEATAGEEETRDPSPER